MVCTANGEIILCDENADFMQVLRHSPVNLNKQSWRIECMCIFSGGFIIGCKDSTVYVYSATGDPKNPYDESNRFLFK